MSTRAVIVGGGVIGVCCAHALVRRGVEVVLLERQAIGEGASFGNAGVIAAGHPPMNKPDRVRQALWKLLDATTPLYIPPRFDPALAAWLWRFSANCTERKLRGNMRTLGPLGHATLEQFRRLVEEEQLDCAFRVNGYYEVSRTAAGVEHAHRDVRLLREQAFEAEALDGEEIARRMPALKPGAAGGAFFPDAATCDPYRFVLELADRVRRRGGRVEAGVPVIEVQGGASPGVRTASGDRVDADAVVLATGAYSLELAGRLGCRLPIQPGKGYHRDLDTRGGEGPSLDAACVLGETSVFCTPMPGRIRFAGTMEFSGWNHRMRPARLAQLTTAADQYLHGVRPDRTTSEWCGLRPCSPDGLPVVGAVPGQERVFVATGHAMAGLTLGPVTGSIVADLVTGAAPGLEIGPLDPGRF